MKYTIISAISSYEIKDIYNLVMSINDSGFIGNKIMFLYSGINDGTKQFLSNNGWVNIEMTLTEGTLIHNQRFIDVANELDNIETDVVIFLDGGDVIFQKNPTEWLDKNMLGDILVTSESLKFKDDDWATEIGLKFPDYWEQTKNSEICNVGVVIGKKDYIKDLFTLIYNTVFESNRLNELVDQFIFNVLIRNKKYNTQFIKQQEGLAAHLAVNFKYLEPYYFTEKMGKILDNGNVINDSGNLFYIVHQYKRNKTLNKLIDEKYDV